MYEGLPISPFTDFSPINNEIQIFINNLANLRSNQSDEIAIPLGFMDLDKILNGGLTRKQLHLLGGAKGEGKTSLALNFAINSALRYKSAVAFISTESTPQYLLGKMLSSESNVAQKRLFGGQITDVESRKLGHAAGILSESTIKLAHMPQTDILTLVQKSRSMQTKTGLDLLIIDRIEEIKADSTQPLSATIRNLATELNCAILGVTSTIPSPYSTRRNSISESADTILHLEQGKDEELNGIAKIKVTYNRNGPTGSVQLLFKARTGKYLDLEMYTVN